MEIMNLLKQEWNQLKDSQKDRFVMEKRMKHVLVSKGLIDNIDALRQLVLQQKLPEGYLQELQAEANEKGR